MPYASFEHLEVWQRSCRLAVDLCKNLQGCKEYSLKDQMIRAALSIPSNIAEGAERGSKPEFVRFLYVAKGSAAELRTQLYIVAKLETIIPVATATGFISELKEISNMLFGLIKSQKS